MFLFCAYCKSVLISPRITLLWTLWSCEERTRHACPDWGLWCAAVQSLSRVPSLRPHGLQHARLPFPPLSVQMGEDVTRQRVCARVCSVMPPLCDPMGCSTPGSPSLHLACRWAKMWRGSASVHACAQLCPLSVTPWAAARQAPLSMAFSKQEYWSGLPCLPPGDLPNPGIEPTSPEAPALQVDSLPLSYQGSPKSHQGCSLWHLTTLGILSNLWLLFGIQIAHLKVRLH